MISPHTFKVSACVQALHLRSGVQALNVGDQHCNRAREAREIREAREVAAESRLIAWNLKTSTEYLQDNAKS